MTTPDRHDADPPFADQVTAALRQRGAEIDARPGGRAAIDRRIGRRARDRRVRRLGIAAAVLVMVIVGALTLLRSGSDDTNVVTVPGVPAVHIPQLGLPPGAGTNRIFAYSPGRYVFLAIVTDDATYPAGGVGAGSSKDRGGDLRIMVTDVPLDEMRSSLGPDVGPAEPSSVNGHPAEIFGPDPSGPALSGTVVWQVAPHVEAMLTLNGSASSTFTGPAAAHVAAGLVELDDAAWSALLDPPPVTTWLGLTGRAGRGEIAEYSPGVAGGKNLRQALDTPGWDRGTFLLSEEAIEGPIDLWQTPGSVDGDTQAPDAAGGDQVPVRGTVGRIRAVEGLAQKTPYTDSLLWTENGVLYELDFTAAASPADAVEVAGRLRPLSATEWQALLFPSTLRTDLVPMLLTTTKVDGDPGGTGSAPTSSDGPPTTGG
jgi:hypothetical protein